MGLSSFFKRAPAAEAGRRQSPPQGPGAIETLRTRARRRLIGVAVLVGGAVLGLPRLFDAPPRPADQPVAVRVAGQERASAVRPIQPEPIVTPGVPVVPAPAGVSAAALTAGAAKPMAALPVPAPRAVSRDDGIITEPKPDPQAEAMQRRREQERKAQLERERLEKAQKAAKIEKERAEKEKAEKLRLEREKERERAAKAEKARQERLEQLRAEKAREPEKAREAEKQRARRDKDKADKSEKADKADKGHRYVVQVGSYSETRAVREARQRVDRLGLDSFEQHVETSSGARTRVRLGPFATKDEATRAAAKLKAAGMNAAVLPL